MSRNASVDAVSRTTVAGISPATIRQNRHSGSVTSTDRRLKTMTVPRRVLVTGASRGVGRAVAAAFAARGDRVAIHHRDSADLAASLRAALPGQGHVVVRADLADPAAVAAMVDAAAEALGGQIGGASCRER